MGCTERATLIDKTAVCTWAVRPEPFHLSMALTQVHVPTTLNMVVF